jgi:hypothetical protein
MQQANDLPVAIIGGGPVGLAALAQLLDRGIDTVLLEAGAQVGAHFLHHGHVRLFSPWKFNVAAPIERRLRAAGRWPQVDPEAMPLAGEIAAQVLAPFAALPEVAPSVRLRHRVLGIAREGFDKVKSRGRETAPFVLHIAAPDGELRLRARHVIDASGTWSNANPLGANGLLAIGEEEAAAQIFYGIPDVLGHERQRYAGKRVLVVGAGHSAANTLLDLAQLASAHAGTTLVWAVRGGNPARAFGGGAKDELPARGKLGLALRELLAQDRLTMVTDFRIGAVSRVAGTLTVHGTRSDGSKASIDGIDEIICATGQRPDLALTRELRLKLDPWLESAAALGPMIDPNLHSCGSVMPHGHRELSHPEPGFYTVGVKSYGRAPTFLLMTGYEQVRSVVVAIAGDMAAADRVELVLPETGVCTTDGNVTVGGCCAPAPVAAKLPTTISIATAAPAEPAERPQCCS